MGVKAGQLAKKAAALDPGASSILALGAVALVFVMYTESRVKQAAASVGGAVNPVNQDNVFNSGVDAVGQAVSGKENWTLGGWIYDMTHDPIEKTTPLPEIDG